MSKPLKYRKMPVVIEAMRFYADELVMVEVARWCGGRIGSEAKASDHTDVAYWIDIPTLEGVMKADPGDYIIKGVQGEFYPCKPDIFDATYERIEYAVSDYLNQIEQRAEDARRNRKMYSKTSLSRRITNEESAKDVPRLLAAIRDVERLVGEAPQGVRFRSDWEDGRAALAQEIRVAITDAEEVQG